jgi:hypothetical protein
MSKQIFSKIAKIGEEVRAAEVIKVELSIKDDFEAAFESAVDAQSEAAGEVSLIRKQIEKVESSLNAARTKYVETNKIGNKFESAAKELGLDISSTPAPNVKTIMLLCDGELQVIDKIIQKLKSIKSELNSL